MSSGCYFVYLIHEYCMEMQAGSFSSVLGAFESTETSRLLYELPW